MPTLTFTPESCNIVCEPTTVMTELAFSLEFMANNFTGRGVYRWSIDRMKGDDGTCIVMGKSLAKSGPMQISQVATLGSAVQQKIIPFNIQTTDSFVLGEEKPVMTDGQNRLGRRLFNRPGKANPDGWTESMIESKDVNPEAQIAVLSYGFADMITGLFALGVRHAKYQFSRMTTQLYLKHMMDDEKLVRYFVKDGEDYPITMKVSDLI